MSILTATCLSRAPLFAFAAEGVFWGAFAALIPEIKTQIGATDGEFGTAMLFSAIGAVSAMWLAPKFDALLGRRAMAAAAALLAISFLFPALTSSFWLFTVLMVVAGAASGLLDVVMNARVSMIESAHNTSLMNLNHAMFSLAYAGAALATGIAREAQIAPWMVFLGISALVLSVVPLMIQNKTAPSPEAIQQSASHRVNHVMIWGGMIVLISFMAESATEGWSALFIERDLGGRAAQGALGPAILGLTMGVGRLAGQFLAERLKEDIVIKYAATLAALGTLVAAIAPSPFVAYLGFGLAGLGVSVVAPMAFSLVGRRFDKNMRAYAIARVSVLGYFGFFIGPPLMGWISEVAGLRASFISIAVVLGFVPICLFYLNRNARND